MADKSLLESEPVAVLLGGGIESTRLVLDFLTAKAVVIPLHVSCGLIWDQCELAFIERFLERQRKVENWSDRLQPLIEISISLDGFLHNHWGVTGRHVPSATASAADLEIPLRNLLLLGLAVQRLKHLPRYRLALGTTADNHYPDGSREYFDRCAAVLSLEAGHPVDIETPLIGLRKAEVIRGAPHAALALSFSCVNPQQGGHCGKCIKCGRRQEAFRDAGIPDPTEYAAT